MKKLVTALLCATLLTQAVPTWAKANAVVVGQVKMLSKGTVITDTYDAPKLKVTLSDLEEYAGEKVRVNIELDGAVWTERTGVNLLCSDLENITIFDIAAADKGEAAVDIKVDIPSSIKEEDKISFTLPLMIETMDEQSSVRMTTFNQDNGVLEEEQKIAIVTSGDKVLQCDVEAYPMIDGKGVMAPIIFSEIYPASLNSQETIVSLQIENSVARFGEISYLSKQEYSVDTDYILEASKYVEYQDGFSGMNEDIKMKIRKDSPDTLIFTLSGQAPLDVGKIVLKNIPVVLDELREEEDLKVVIKGEGILNSGDSYVVGLLRPNVTEEEKSAEETLEEVEGIGVQEIAEKEVHSKVEFTVAQYGYVKDGVYTATATKPYIQEPGSIMIPIKDVAIALGVEASQISYLGSTVTIYYKEDIIEVTKGSNEVKVNGTLKKMNVPTVIQSNKMFIPVGEVAQLLGVDVQWDGANKTAIFKS